MAMATAVLGAGAVAVRCGVVPPAGYAKDEGGGQEQDACAGVHGSVSCFPLCRPAQKVTLGPSRHSSAALRHPARAGQVLRLLFIPAPFVRLPHAELSKAFLCVMEPSSVDKPARPAARKVRGSALPAPAARKVRVSALPAPAARQVRGYPPIPLPPGSPHPLPPLPASAAKHSHTPHRRTPTPAAGHSWSTFPTARLAHRHGGGPGNH